MAITSPGLVLAIPALFGFIKPKTDTLLKLGATDFAAAADGILDVKPGATLKVPISSVTGALEYDYDDNNYCKGGDTSWASLTATHFLQGYDISGEDVDKGASQQRMEQLFARRAGAGIAMAMQGVVKDALDGATESTGVTVPAIGTADLSDYMNIANSVVGADGEPWLDKSASILAVNSAAYADIKKLFAAGHIIGTDAELAAFMGFADLVLVPGMTARFAVIPPTSVGFIARVPAIVADYPQAGVQVDDATGLAVGIVVANDQCHNRRIVNADLWFGVKVLSANAAATTAGVIKIS